MVAAVVIALAVAVIDYFRPSPLPERLSIAVLPLENLSGDPEQDYYGIGVTDGIIGELARIPNLRVATLTNVRTLQEIESADFRHCSRASGQSCRYRLRISWEREYSRQHPVDRGRVGRSLVVRGLRTESGRRTGTDEGLVPRDRHRNSNRDLELRMYTSVMRTSGKLIRTLMMTASTQRF